MSDNLLDKLAGVTSTIPVDILEKFIYKSIESKVVPIWKKHHADIDIMKLVNLDVKLFERVIADMILKEYAVDNREAAHCLIAVDCFNKKGYFLALDYVIWAKCIGWPEVNKDRFELYNVEVDKIIKELNEFKGVNTASFV